MMTMMMIKTGRKSVCLVASTGSKIGSRAERIRLILLSEATANNSSRACSSFVSFAPVCLALQFRRSPLAVVVGRQMSG